MNGRPALVFQVNNQPTGANNQVMVLTRSKRPSIQIALTMYVGGSRSFVVVVIIFIIVLKASISDRDIAMASASASVSSSSSSVAPKRGKKQAAAAAEAAAAATSASDAAAVAAASKKRCASSESLSSSSSSTSSEQTPKRQNRSVASHTLADKAASTSVSGGGGENVIGYVLCTNGDVQEIRSQSCRLEHVVDKLFLPKLVELRKDKAPIERVSVQYVRMSDRWMLVIDEEGVYYQPFNYGIGSFVGDPDAQWHGRILVVRTKTEGGETLSSLEPLPSRPSIGDEDDYDYDDAHCEWLENVATMLQPFRKAYRAYCRGAQSIVDQAKAMGIHVI